MKKTIIAAAFIAATAIPAIAAPQQPPTPEVRKAITAIMKMAPKPPMNGAVKAAAPVLVAFTYSSLDYTKPTGVPLGWHSALASYCGWGVDKDGNQLFFLLPADTTMVVGAGNEPNVPAALASACVHKSTFFWHVIDFTTGTYDTAFEIGQ